VLRKFADGGAHHSPNAAFALKKELIGGQEAPKFSGDIRLAAGDVAARLAPDN
jgi:hypothetical protein